MKSFINTPEQIALDVRHFSCGFQPPFLVGDDCQFGLFYRLVCIALYRVPFLPF